MTQPASPIQIPLSQVGSASAFAAAVSSHVAALTAHRTGPAKVAAPVASALVSAVVAAVPATGPVAQRGPDTFQVAPYEVFDDTPRTPEQQQSLQVLRETIK